MKAIVDAVAFAAALKKVMNVPQHSRIDLLEQVRVDFTDNACRLTATDMRCWGLTELPARGDAFSLTFANTKAVERVCRFFSGELCVELRQDPKGNHSVLLSCGGKSGEFPLLADDTYPTMPEEAPNRRYTITAGSVLERMKRVSYATGSYTDQRPELSAIRFESNHIWCLDGARMAVSDDDALRIEGRFLVPARAVELLKMFGNGEITIEQGKRYVTFRSADTTLMMENVFTSDSLHVESILAGQGNQICFVERKKLLDGVKYLESCAQGAKKPYVVFDYGTLTLENAGSTYQVTALESTACPCAFTFDNRHMKEALAQFSGHDQVILRVGKFPSPIVLTAEDTGDLALVLPVRMKNMPRQQAA